MEDDEALDIVQGGGGLKVMSAIPPPIHFTDLQPVGAPIDPFQTAPSPSTDPDTFYPDPPTPEPNKPAITVLSATGEHRYKFHFHPDQAYGEQWVDEHKLAYAAFMRDPIISFVRSVAGEQGQKDANAFLKTGFEDIMKIMRSSLPQTFDMFPGGAGGGGTLSLGGGSGPDPPGKGTIVRNPNVFNQAAMEELKDIVEVLQSYGRAEDALRAYAYLSRQSAVRDAAVVQWLTLPMNLGQIYFVDTLKSAIEDALEDIRTYKPLPEGGTFFEEILAVTLDTDLYKRLVSKALDIST